MKAKSINLKHIALIVFLALTQVACDNAVFSSDDGRRKANFDGNTPLVETEDIVFLDDSFERDDIFIDIANQIIYGWRGFILDGADPILGLSNPDTAAIRIPPSTEFGPAAHLDRALYMYGDPDSEIEVLHVVSQSYDLSQYNTAVITFKYITFGLNDADDAAPEHLQLQVCRGTLNECGANDDLLDPNGLVSDNWVTVFSSENNNVDDDALNGKNHVVSDWQQGLVAVDLNDEAFVGSSSTFVFRFVATMEEGLAQGTCTQKCENKCDRHNRHRHHNKDRHPATQYSTSTTQEDTHQHQTGKGHSSHGNGHGYGHYKERCKKHHCRKKCTEVCQPGDGSLRDGVAIDQVLGQATTRTIDEIF